MTKYSFTYLEKFGKDYKEAKKKNPKLDEEFESFIVEFNHTLGDAVKGTGGAQKIRMSRADKGKSGGYRVYYYFTINDKIYLLRFYPKSDKEELSIKEKIEIFEIVKAIKE
jgi:hypothetical protein